MQTLKSLKSIVGALCAALLTFGATACGLGTAGGYSPSGTLSGPIKGVDLKDAKVAVGSKNFTEQIILGKLAVILFKSAGADVEDLTNVPGSNSAREAMIKGDINFQWEYTGTAWISYLGHDDPITDEQEQYEAVLKADREKGLEWLPPAPMNNTYGFAIPRAKAEELGISKLSDLAKLPDNERTYCVESEFANRNDGFQPMLKHYNIPAASKGNVSTLDTGAIYQATADGLCNFGEVFTTDGRIKALDLQVMEDDRQFFPKYNLSGVVRQELLEAYPQIKDLLEPVSEKLTNETLIDLNAEVDVDGREPVDVAYDWLKEEGFVTE